MKRFKIQELLTKIFNSLAIVLFLVLFVFSFCSSWVNLWDLKEEYVYQMPDSFWKNLLGLMFVLLVFGALYYWEKRHPIRGNMDIIAGIFSIVIIGLCIYWIEASNTMPNGDQYAISLCAEEFEAGDYTRLGKGGYVSVYPQQLGLITFVRILFRLFGTGNYKAFQYFNAVMAGLLVFSGYQVVKKLSGNNRLTALFYMMWMVACVPLYCYVPFVYGEMASTALVMFGAWMLLSVLEHFSPIRVAALSLAMGLAVQFRKNVLIFLIAFSIVIVLHFLQRVRWQDIVTITGIILGVLVLQACVDACYKKLIPEDSRAIPNIAYIAMGVNDDKGLAGWHNGYDVDIMKLTDYDVEAAKQASRGVLTEFLGRCKEEPLYALSFYYRKVSMQWNAPMYQCLAMNNLFAGEQGAFAKSVYFGFLRKVAEYEMNIYQLAVYGSILFLLITKRKTWLSTEKYLLLIGVFGGFLFSLMWESKTRYVVPYFLVMLPYVAIGIYEFVEKIHGIFYLTKKKSDVCQGR